MIGDKEIDGAQNCQLKTKIIDESFYIKIDNFYEDKKLI
jgi:hypothetical protein